MPMFVPPLRPVLRSLRRQPGFAATAILTLALGIGVNVAIFSAIEALVINPLPYPRADRMVAIYEDASWIGYAKNTPAPANFLDWKRQATSFEDMGATADCRAVFTGDSAPEEVRCRFITANLLPLLGVRPVIGRWFNAAEDHPEPNVALIGEGLWTRRFARSPGILTRTVQINGRGVRIVGVMPGWFHFAGDREMEMWSPIGFTPERWARRGSHFLRCFGLLKPGVSLERANAELKAIQTRINERYPKDTDPRLSAWAEPIGDALLGKMRGALWILMGAAGMVLLIACANIANLLLARATRRRHEMAVRTALGASRGDLIRQIFAETLVLTAAGCAAGIVLALWSRRLLENFVPATLQGTVSIGLDARSLLFAAGASLLAAAIATLTPAIHLLRASTVAALREDSRTGTAHGVIRLRGILVAAEVALTVALLSGAGLMIRSLMAIWKTDLGFNPARLMVSRVSLPATKYPDDARREVFYSGALDRIRAIPGVAAADFTSTPPFYSIGNSMGFAIEGRTPEGQWERSDMLVRCATPGYLATIGARLTAGRFLTAADRDGAQDVVIVNESFARAFYPDKSALGKRMSLSDTATRRWRTIVGVVKEVSERGYDYAPKPVTYLPLRQLTDWSADELVVRSAGATPDRLLNSIRKAILDVDPDQPIGLTRTFDQILAIDQASRRQQMFLLAAFAALSLVMSALGIYAVLAYSVELRVREIGVRMALGAGKMTVMRMVVSDGMTLVAAGGFVGFLAAASGGRLLRASLYGVEPFDPITLAAVCGFLALVALAACWIPSRRAAATPPAEALRS
jgi:putative ABC transport system permease protein